MNKRPILALVGAALVVIAVVIFILPNRSDQSPASANGPVEGQAQLNPGGKASQASDTSGVTTPPEPQPELEIEKLSAGQQPPQFVVVSFDGGVESKTGIKIGSDWVKKFE